MFDRDFVFYGKYAYYAKYLCKDRGQEKEERANIFDREIDVMMAAPLVGVIKNKYISDPDNSSDHKEDRSTVQLSQIASERSKLMTIYRAVMLANSHDEDLSDKDKLSQAFRCDNLSDQENKNNLQIFYSYMRGGLEYMYEYFKNDASYTKSRKEKQADEIIDFVNEFKNINTDN